MDTVEYEHCIYLYYSGILTPYLIFVEFEQANFATC